MTAERAGTHHPDARNGLIMADANQSQNDRAQPAQPALTTVVNKYRESYDVYIGRGSIWGNPFVLERDGSREEVIAMFEEYYLRSPELKARVGSLKGKRLGCFCAPTACHGDVLARYAELA